jgi:hypothetical protein
VWLPLSRIQLKNAQVACDKLMLDTQDARNACRRRRRRRIRARGVHAMAVAKQQPGGIQAPQQLVGNCDTRLLLVGNYQQLGCLRA